MIDHIGSEKTPRHNCTAVRNLGQWPNGWTGNFGECKYCKFLGFFLVIRRGCKKKPGMQIFGLIIRMKFWVYTDNDNMHIQALTNYVPAVAVIRKRLVLFILIRFKGYLDGSKCLITDYIATRVLCEESST